MWPQGYLLLYKDKNISLEETSCVQKAKKDINFPVFAKPIIAIRFLSSFDSLFSKALVCVNFGMGVINISPF